MMMVVVGGVLGMKGGTMPSNEEDLSNENKMREDSNDDNDGKSGGGVRDERGDNAKLWRRFEQQRQDELG